MRTWCAPSLYPCRRGVIPEYWFHAIIVGIAYGILNISAILHLVPFGINEYVWPVHLHSHIHILLHNLIVVGAMIVCPVYPRHRTWLYPRCVLNAARVADIGDKSGSHHVFQLAHNNHSPWRKPLPRDVLQVFIHHHSIFLLVAVVVKRRRTIPSVYSSLGDQGKDIIIRLNKSGIAPTFVFVLARCG